MPDDARIEHLRRFARDFERTLASTPRSLTDPDAERFSASDPSGTVTCVVDIRGDFVDLSIGDDWWYTVGPAGIASVILDTIAFAQQKATLAMTLLHRHGHRVPPRTDKLRNDEPTQKTFSDIAEEWAAAQARIERAYTLMEQVERVAKLRDSAEPRTICGPRAIFRLHLVGITIQSAEVNQRAISPTETGALIEDVRAAFRQAIREKDPAYA